MAAASLAIDPFALRCYVSTCGLTVNAEVILDHLAPSSPK